jgi:HEPN domain-containing protein
MKDTTQQWLNFAETDLRTCKKIIGDGFLTNVVAFHSQQAVEKCFKAIIDEKELQIPRIHSLTRLYGVIQDNITFTVDNIMLQKVDSVYATSRYPSDFGLIPEGKPSQELAEQLYEFAKSIYNKTTAMIEN